jgi:hypothetical protein
MMKERLLEGGGRSAHALKHKFGDYALLNLSEPEAAVGYREGFVQELLSSKGLRIKEPIHSGSWAGRDPETSTSYQDILILTHKA